MAEPTLEDIQENPRSALLDPDIQRIIKDRDIQIDPNWDEPTAIKHIQSEMNKIAGQIPTGQITLQEGFAPKETGPKPEPPKPKEMGIIEGFWKNFPVKRAFSRLGEGTVRLFENIPKAAVMAMVDDPEKERRIEESFNPISRAWSEYNIKDEMEDAKETAHMDQILADQDLGEKILNPYWYTKNIGQTGARLFPELLSILITKKPLSLGAGIQKLAKKEGAKKAATSTAKKAVKNYLTDISTIATRVLVNSTIDASEERGGIFKEGLRRGMSEEEAHIFADKGFEAAMPMNALIYGISNTISRYFVAPQVLKGLSTKTKQTIATRLGRVGGGWAKNWAVETFLEEIPQSMIPELALKHAEGGDINILSVFGPDTYRDILSNPHKREIMALTAWMTPLLTMPDLVAAYKGNPSTTKAPDGTLGTNRELTSTEIIQLPPEEGAEFVLTEEQLVEISESPQETKAFAIKTMIEQLAGELDSLTGEQVRIVAEYIGDQQDPVAELKQLEKAKEAIENSPEEIDAEVMADIDNQIDRAFAAAVSSLDSDMTLEHAELFEHQVKEQINERSKEIDASKGEFNKLMADINLMEEQILNDTFAEINPLLDEDVSSLIQETEQDMRISDRKRLYQRAAEEIDKDQDTDGAWSGYVREKLYGKESENADIWESTDAAQQEYTKKVDDFVFGPKEAIDLEVEAPVVEDPAQVEAEPAAEPAVKPIHKSLQRFLAIKIQKGGGLTKVTESRIQKNMSEITPDKTVYHDSGLANAKSLIKRILAGPRTQNFYVSDDLDLALGQKGTTGYILEFDTDMINGSKPDSLQNQNADAIGGANEYVVDKTLKKSLKSIIVPNLKGLNALRKIKGLDNIFDFDNTIEVERGIKLVRKGAAQKVSKPALKPEVKAEAPKKPKAAAEPVMPTVEKFPRTVKVDGETRSTTNSEGEPIASTKGKVEKFYKWFKDSIIVDKKNKPKVVYHGTNRSFDTFQNTIKWVSESPKLASLYAEARGVVGANVYPLYANAKNMYNITKQRMTIRSFVNQAMKGKDATPEQKKMADEIVAHWSNIGLGKSMETFEHWNLTGVDGPRMLVKLLTDLGYDGISFLEGNEPTYGLFEATQLKSASGNGGSFDPVNPSLLFSFKPGKDGKASFEQIKENVERAMPEGSLITETEGGLDITLPNGQQMHVPRDIDNIPDDAVGVWDTVNMIMQLSGRSDQITADHEYQHAAEQLVLDQSDRDFLRKKVGDVEKTADTYAEWVKGKRQNLHSGVQKLFNRIKDFFIGMADMFGIKTKESIFNKIRKGKQDPSGYSVAEQFLYQKRTHDSDPVDKANLEEFEAKIDKVRETAGKEYDQAVKEKQAAKEAKEIAKEVERTAKQGTEAIIDDIAEAEAIIEEASKDTPSALRALRKFIMKLKRENRGFYKILSGFENIAQVKKPETRKKRLKAAKEVIDKYKEMQEKDSLLKRIKRIANWAEIKKKNNRLMQKNLPLDVNRRLKPILKAIEMTAEEVEQRIAELRGTLDLNEDQELELMALERYGNLPDMDLAALEVVYNDIMGIYKTGRMRAERSKFIEREVRKFLLAKGLDDSGNVVGRETFTRDESEKKFTQKMKERSFFTDHMENAISGFQDLMEKIYGRNSQFTTYINSIVNRAGIKEIKGLSEARIKRDKAFANIFGITGNAVSKAWKTLRERTRLEKPLNEDEHNVTKVEDGKRIKLADFSLAEAYRLWQLMTSGDFEQAAEINSLRKRITNLKQQSKNAESAKLKSSINKRIKKINEQIAELQVTSEGNIDVVELMIENGFDAQTLEALNELMDSNPDVKKWAEYEVNEFYPYMWEKLAPLYRSIHNVDPPKIEKGYVPLEFFLEFGMEDLAKEGMSVLKARTASGNLLLRKRHNLDLKRSSGLRVLENYIDNNVNVMTWAEPLQRLESVFNAEMLLSIEQNQGKNTADAVRGHLKALKQGSADKVMMMNGWEKWLRRVSRHFLGLNIFSGIKNTIQVVNFGKAYDDSKDHLKWAFQTRRGIKDVLENQTMITLLKDRFFNGNDALMRAAFSQGRKVKGNMWERIVSFTEKVSYMPIQAGDAVAVILGSPYYSYRLEQYMKTMPKEEAQKRAAEDFFDAIERTQSHTTLFNSPTHHLQAGSLARAMTMMTTGLLPIARQALSAIRRLSHGEERFIGLRDLGYALILVPATYTAMEAITDSIQGHDDDDEYWKKWAINSLASPTGTLPVTGPVVNAFANIFLRGHNYGKGIELTPGISPMNRFVRESERWSRKKTPDRADDKRWFNALLDMAAGYSGVPRQITKYGVNPLLKD